MTSASSPSKLLAGRDSHVPRPTATAVGWTDLDIRAVDTARLLAADAVQKVGNGHPGTAISLAPAAYLLYQHVMTHDPSARTSQRHRHAVSTANPTSASQTSATVGIDRESLRSSV